MRPPQLSSMMIRHITFGVDPHLEIKLLNQVIADKFDSDNGKCPHRPSNIVAKVTGDFSEKASGSFCVYCGEEIVIEKIVWSAKHPLPTNPRPA